MVDRPTRSNHVKNKTEVEENPYFDKNKGENNKDHSETHLSRERNENEQDMQTRSNIHLSDHSSDGKGEDVAEDTQTRSNIYIRDEAGDGKGVDVDGANEHGTVGQREQQPIEQETSRNNEEQEQVETNEQPIVSTGRSTSAIQFIKPDDVIESERANAETPSATQNAGPEQTSDEQQLQQGATQEAEIGSKTAEEEALLNKAAEEATEEVVEEVVEEATEEVTEEVAEEAKEEAVEEVVPNNAPVINGVELEEFSSKLSLNEEDGSGGYAALSGLDDFPTEALTIQINFTSDQPPVSSETNGISLMSYAASGSDNEFLLFAEPSGTLSVYINGQRTPLDVGSNELFDGESHDLAVSWDSETGEVAIYVDGNLTDTAIAQAGQPLTAGGTLMLGQEQDSVGGGFDGGQEFAGEFHSIEVFSEVRTAEEIAADIDASPTGDAGSLVLGFDFSSDEPLNNLAGDEVFVLDGGATIVSYESGMLEEDSSGINGQVAVSDLDNDDLSFSISNEPAEGTVTVNEDGLFHFNPGDGFQDLGEGETREVSFEIEVTDGQGGVDTQTVTVTVTGKNDGPEADALSVEATEDNSVGGQLTASDVEGDNLSFSVHEQPNEGSVIVNSDGSFSFSADNDFQDLGDGESRETSFSYEVTDENGGTAIETVTVTVTGTNDAPEIGYMANVTGSLGEAETTAGMAMSFNEDGRSGDVAMVENMSDFPTEELTVELSFSSTEPPQAGETNGTSLFSYNAPGGENEFLLFTEPSGTLGVYINGQRTAMDADMNDLFDGEYHHLAVSWDSETGEIAVYVDGNLTDTATAQAGNPIGSDGTMTLGQEQDSLGGGFDNRQDFSGKITDVQIFDEVRDAGLIEQDASTGGIAVDDDSLVHAYDFNHSDGNSVSDQSANNDMGFNGSVIVEDADLIRQIGDVELIVEEDSSGVTGTLIAKDAEGDDVSFSIVEGPAEGSININEDGTFEFSPDADFQDLGVGDTREVSFTYQADDGNGGIDSSTVTVTVKGTNDGPIAVDDSASGAEDSVISGNVLTNDSDVDGTITVQNAGTHATDHGSITINADGSYDYTADADYNGTDSFDVTIVDDDGATSTSTINLTVSDVNDGPTAVDDSASGAEDSVISGNVLTNDSDVDGTITVEDTGTFDTAHGSITINADGSYDYTPDADYSGTDSFDVTIVDDDGATSTSTINLTVDAVADEANLSLGSSATTNMFTSGAEATDYTNTNNSTWINGNYDGWQTDSTAIEVHDTSYTGDAASEGSQWFELNQGGGNQDATNIYRNVDTNENGTYEISFDLSPRPGYDEDVNSVEVYWGGELLDTISLDGSGLTDTDWQTFTYTVEGDGDPARFEFKSVGTEINNGRGMFLDNVKVDETIEESGNSVSGNSGSAFDLPEISASLNDTDGSESLAISISGIPDGVTIADGDGNTYTASDGNDSVDISNWSLDTLTTEVPTGSPDFDLEVKTTSTESGNGDVAVSSQVMSVEVNDGPVAVDDTGSGAEDSVISGNVLTNDSDVDGTITVQNTGTFNTDHGSITINADGSYNYTADTNYNGSDSFEVTIVDDDGATSTATLDLTVTDVNDGPVAVADADSGYENTVINGNVLNNDSDIDGTITVQNTGTFNTDHGSITINADGSYDYTPDADYHGADSFEVTIVDDDGATSTSTLDLTVDSAPVLSVDDVTVIEDPTSGSGNVETVVSGEIVDGGSGTSVDHWEISHNGGDLELDILTNGSGLDSEIALYKDNGDGTYTKVGGNDDGGWDAHSDGGNDALDSYLSMGSLDAGNYVVAVSSYYLDDSISLNTESDYPHDNGHTSGGYQLTVNGDASVEYAANPDAPGESWGDVSDAATVVSVDGEVSGFNTVEMTFTVTLDEAPTAGPVTVDYSTVDGSATVTDGDYQSQSGTVTFEVGETSKTVTITVNSDDITEGTESLSLEFNNLSGGATFDPSATETSDGISVIGTIEEPNIIEGTEASGGTNTIDINNFTSTDQGFTVTAQNVSGGELTDALASNLSTFGSGFGAGGTVSDTDSGVMQQIAYDQDSGLSERLVVDFDSDVSSADFSFANLYTSSYSEEAHWQTFNDGVLVAEGDFTADGSGGSGTISINTGETFDQLVFTANEQTDGSDGSDFMITEVNYTNVSNDGNDIINGTSDNDHISGLSGDDTISGADGADTIIGGDGNDTIDGGVGDDILNGGDGDDTLTFLAHQGNDIVDGGEGGLWTDTLELGGFDGQGSQEGWTLSLDDGSSIASTDELNSEIVFSGDAGGTITFDDGGSVDFENIEKIVW